MNKEVHEFLADMELFYNRWSRISFANDNQWSQVMQEGKELIQYYESKMGKFSESIVNSFIAFLVEESKRR
ncbi:hypothetical protein [Levyella massiliensis]|uniref:hypothetical protein n=1 Tax=Levyella massiliensis TaxID=938289 RepID=UPI0024AD20BB|nr:hypothetical protein [Levyella massiliensis]